ncbi:hypothetical protein Tco_0484600 [Tanacetum coccineum]
MSKEERCNTTLRLGIGAEVKREKQLKQKTRGFRLDLALPVHTKVEVTNHGDCDHKHDEEKDDQDSCISKTIDDLEEKEKRGTKRSDSSNLDVYHENSGGSRKKLKLTTKQITLLEDSFKIHSTLNTLKQIEQECALLKKCCETLSEENRRLKKELREARCSSKLDLHHHQQPQLPPSFYIRYSSKTEKRHQCDNIGKTVGLFNASLQTQSMKNARWSGLNSMSHLAIHTSLTLEKVELAEVFLSFSGKVKYHAHPMLSVRLVSEQKGSSNTTIHVSIITQESTMDIKKKKEKRQIQEEKERRKAERADCL